MAIIVQLILSLLGSLALRWLIDLLTKSAAGLNPTGDNAADARTLLTCALEDPDLLFHPLRRAVVAFLLAKAPAAVAAKSNLSPADQQTLDALAARTE